MPAPFSESRRQRYRLHLQIGTALALGLVLVAFSLPLAPEAPAAPPRADTTPFVGIELPPTDLTAPPPPPPPKTPPPREVPDDQAEDEVIATLEITFDAPAAIGGPPAPPAPPPVPPRPPEADTPSPVANDGADTPDTVEFLPIGDQPVLIGGLEGLQRRVTYPEIAQRVGAQGKVFVRFVVDETGRVVEPEVLRAPHPSLAEAAIRAVSESRFTPGHQRGRPVRVRYTLPVEFVLR